MSVKVRFAPSPTGFVHIGSLRTALYNYLFAKRMGGEYLLRVEDTDQTRLVEGAIENMLQAMNWAGVNHTEGVMLDENGKIVQKGENGPYIQSERLDIYKKYIQELLDNGKAYYCFCTKERLDEVREKQKEAGETTNVITTQTRLALDGLSKEQVEGTIIAYEPIWAIGTGKTATSEDANNSIKEIRKEIAKNYGQEVADRVIIQYGGSVKSSNAKELFTTSDIDGGLVGGASLKADEFAKIVNFDK